MGVVYVVRDTRLDRLVALKFLPADLVSDPSRRQRFVREAKAASALNHPYIVTMHDIDEVDGHQFLVLELLEGQSLRERIGGNPLPLAEVLALGAQIADALEAAHGSGILHRDVKPDNIFVTNGGQINLFDFGLARLVAAAADAATADATRTSLTGLGATVGTLACMSPEQARGEALDVRTDVFSFGAVLYEMTTGRAAFGGGTAATVLDGVLNRQPPPVTESNAAAPAALAALIGKALRKEREARHASAAELRTDLDRLRHAVPRSPDGPASPARRWPLPVALVAALVLLGLALLYGTRGVWGRPGNSGAEQIDSLAVIPLANLSGDPRPGSSSRRSPRSRRSPTSTATARATRRAPPRLLLRRPRSTTAGRRSTRSG